MAGRLITFEGTEGSGKSTQIQRLKSRIECFGMTALALREPGGTPIGEEIRHTLKHSKNNAAMTPEAELLLMNASRAQLVRELIRPALKRGTIVLCDRFYDSTTVYQGYGRGLDLASVRRVVDLAVGEIRPNLTLLLRIPQQVSEQRIQARQATMSFVRDRMEEADRDFFLRVQQGYDAIAAAEPERIKVIDASADITEISESIWAMVKPLLLTR